MEDKALKLWIELFEKLDSPIYAGEMGGDLFCFFCGEFNLNPGQEEHTAGCIWVRAKALVEEHQGAKGELR